MIIKNKFKILEFKIKNLYFSFFKNYKRNFSSLRILEKNFTENSKFSFIQVGANDGVNFDYLYDFVLKRKSEGIVIEPVNEYYEELKKNYADIKNIICVNKAVHPFEKEVNIYKIKNSVLYKYPDWVKGIASLDKSHHQKSSITTDDIEVVKVLADSFQNIVEEYYLFKNLDYIQIDTEGFDYEVLKMINFNVFRPKMIKLETVNLSSGDFMQVKLLLKNNGYFTFDEFGDTVGVNLNKIILS